MSGCELPAFFFDAGSPYAYLAAERVEAVLGTVEWSPVLLGAMFRAAARRSWAEGPGRAAGVREVEERARARGLPPVRWPDPWPNDGLLAMRVATWAAQEGAAGAFARAALRVQFAEGRALSDPANVEAALRRAGLDPEAGLAAAQTRPVKDALRARTDAALARGVLGVPSVAIGAVVLWGDDRLDDAAALRDRGAA